jgi:hypothetical protein
MYSKLIAWLTAAEHDVEAILANFTSTVDKLEAAAVAKFDEAKDHAAAAVHYQQMSEFFSEAEATVKAKAQEAAEIAERIKGLVTV